ncbi:hypothetical protein Hanom_Chr10g00887231 [Helianthus anomalus]
MLLCSIPVISIVGPLVRLSPVSKSSIRFPLGYSDVNNDLSWSADCAIHSVLSSSEGLCFHGECPTAFPWASIFSFFFLFLLGSSLGGPTRVYFTIPFSILFLQTFFLSLKCICRSPLV